MFSGIEEHISYALQKRFKNVEPSTCGRLETTEQLLASLEYNLISLHPEISLEPLNTRPNVAKTSPKHAIGSI